jgi:ATP-dependent DNA helicase RecQ
MALCAWGDSGWGVAVRNGKYVGGRFHDDLVEECARRWLEHAPLPAPEWVACIPSLRHPDLVPDLARRLAERLGLPFRMALVCTGERPQQKTMANGVQQAKNMDGAFRVATDQVLPGAVLLVDDVVDSRWTLTVAAYLLLREGSGPVLPLVLADAGASR